MKKQKIYAVNDIDKFKEWCEEKIGDRITAEDYIELEQFNDKEIHIVQCLNDNYISPILIQNYIGNSVIKYDICIKESNGWETNNIMRLTGTDIKELIEEGVIEELERKKNILAFKVINAKQFYNEISNDIEDKEFISMISMIGRQRDNAIIYLINSEENDFKILFRDGKVNMLRELTESILDKEKILALLKEDIIANVKCEYSEKADIIKFEKQDYLLASTRNNWRGIVIRSNTNRCIATTYLKSPSDTPNRDKILAAYGKNESVAIKRLKDRLVRYLDHDTEKIINLYSKEIEKEDYDY